MKNVVKNERKIYMYYTTTSSNKEARRIAKILITNNLSVCINVFPSVSSFYNDGNKFCKSNEVIMIIKSQIAKQEFIKNLKKIHNYEIPFISIIESSCMSEKYIKWAYSQTFFSNS